MVDIPEEVKSLFRQDSITKNFRVHFPNGERDDIDSLVNKDVTEGSVQFTESLCSQENLKFGLCEASVLEFETIGVGNIKGYEIEAGIEIDITSLGEDFIAEYGQTSNDVAFPYYYVPYGRFVVDSCKRQSNMKRRKVIAYDALYSGNLDKDLSDIGITRSNTSGYITDGAPPGVNYTGFFHFNMNHYLRMYAVNSNMGSIAQEFGEYAGTFVEEEDSREYNIGVLGVSAGIGATLYVKKMIFEPDTDVITNFGLKSSLELEAYDMEIREIIKGKFEQYGLVLDTNKSIIAPSAGTTETITINPVEIGIVGVIDSVLEDEGTVTINRYITPSLMVEWSDFGRIQQLVLQVPLRLEIYSTSTGDLQVITPLETVTFDECPNVEFYSYPTDSILNFEMKDDVKITSYRSLLSSVLELKGRFGRIDRITGKLEYISLGTEPVTIDKSMFKNDNVWAEEYTTKEYGAISVKYTDEEGEEQILLYQFGEGENTYYMHDNTILNSVKLTAEQIQTIVEELAEQIQGITMVPYEMTTQGMPHLEAGDLLQIETEDGIIESYLLRRELSGIIALTDTSTNSIEEQAKSEVDTTQVIVAMNISNSGGGASMDLATDDDVLNLFI